MRLECFDAAFRHTFSLIVTTFGAIGWDGDDAGDDDAVGDIMVTPVNEDAGRIFPRLKSAKMTI